MAYQPERDRRPGSHTRLRATVTVAVAALGTMLTAVVPATAAPDARPARAGTSSCYRTR